MASLNLARFARGAEIVRYAFQNLPEGLERVATGPGAWSLSELAAHLADAELELSARVGRVVGEREPPVSSLGASLRQSRLMAQGVDVRTSLAVFEAHRRWLHEVLCRLRAPDFARSGMDEGAGRIPLAELVVRADYHLDHHLRFLYAKRGNLGVSLYPRFVAMPDG